MKLVQTYFDYMEANLDLQYLKSEGLDAYLFDEHTITMNWFYAQSLGGIKLMVNDPDFETASALLEARKLEANQSFIPELDEEEEMNLDSTNKVCPHCGSRNTRLEGYEKAPAYISYLLLGFPLFFKSQQYHCFHCGNKFTTNQKNKS